MSRILTLLVAASFGSFAVADDADKNKLEGTYAIVGGEKNGKAIPREEIEGAVVVFKDGKIIGSDKNKKEFFSATYVVDATAKPMKISMTNTSPNTAEVKSTGIVEVNGDAVRLCYNLPGGDVPTDFKTKDRQHCFVLKRTGN